MAHTTPDQRALELIYSHTPSAYADDDGTWFRLAPDYRAAPIGLLIKIQRTEQLDGHGSRYTYAVVDTSTYNR